MILTNFSLIKAELNLFYRFIIDIFQDEIEQGCVIVKYIENNERVGYEFVSKKTYSGFENFYAFQSTQNKEYIVFISNAGDGQSSLMYVTSNRMNVPVYSFSLYSTESEYEENYSFKYKKGEIARAVLLYMEEVFVFYQDGIPLDIEDISYYQKRRKRDRLSNEILIEYINKLGFNFQHETFWESKSEQVTFQRLAWYKEKE
jgi:hypothetical protein